MYEKIVLPNGVRILTEAVPGVRSAALGLWVGTGSRYESAGESGAAHFIEHMLFKGTDRRTAVQLAEEMDAVGGQINAFTTKECTCFYARVLDTHLPQAADMLCDMFFNSRFADGDVSTERGVILEEIGMYEDTPEDLCAERLAAKVFKGTSLARPILGRKATLEGMDGAWLKGYMEKSYGPDKIVVALAGSFRQADVDDLKARFGAMAPQLSPAPGKGLYTPGVVVKKKAIEQNHLTLAFPGLTYADRRRFTGQILSSVLGGGMSSRLFQQVREQRGLCYSVYSYGTCHEDVGYFGVYTALGRETEREALDTILSAIRTFRDEGITQSELDRAREQSKANVLMGLESTQSHMSNLGRGELFHGEVLGAEEIIAAYDAVTLEGVQTLARELFDFSRASLSAVGRVGTAEEYQALLRA